MKMELIQPFINSADAVLSQALQCSIKMGEVSMEGEAYRRQGLAATIKIQGDIEGRVIVDLEPSTALRVAGFLAGGAVEESDQLVRETVCELANMVIGNAVTLLNDQGFAFKVHPPEIHSADQGLGGSHDTEALVMSFETPHGNVFMNICMRYNRRRSRERSAVVVPET